MAVARSFGRAAFFVVDNDAVHDVFEVVEVQDQIARVRSPFLFEVGEYLTVRIERNGQVTEGLAKVRCHTGDPGAQITELEIGEDTEPLT